MISYRFSNPKTPPQQQYVFRMNAYWTIRCQVIEHWPAATIKTKAEKESEFEKAAHRAAPAAPVQQESPDNVTGKWGSVH